MRTDGIFTLHSFTIDTEIGRPEHLIPVSDIHHDSPSHAAHEFDQFLQYMKEERKDAFCLGVGDYLDFERAHERELTEMLSAESARERLNAVATAEIAKISERLSALNWIGLLSGNHFANITNKTGRGCVEKIHGDAVLADLLGVPYLGVCCGLTITLRDKKARKHADVHVIAHHGVGAAQTIGGGLNRVRRWMSGWDADIALMGHNHQRGILPTEDRISFHNDKLASQTRFVARTGSFLRGYVQNEPNYVTDMALTPASIGWIEFELRLKLNELGKPYVAIRGIQ